MTRICVLLAALMLPLFVSQAQDRLDKSDLRLLSNAQYSFDIGDYLLAREQYMALAKKYPDNPSYNFYAGLTNYKLRQFRKEARPYFEAAANKEYREALFYLALSYHLEEDFDKAVQYLNRYRNHHEEKQQPDSIVQYHYEIALTAQELIRKPIDARIENMGIGINSAYPDYAPLISVDESKLFFTSRRDNSTGKLKDPYGQFFEDVYVCEREGAMWGTAKRMEGPINTESHDACVGITPDGTRLIIYRTNRKLTGGDLYETRLEGIKWTEPEILGPQINSRQNQESAAAFSKDGNTIYFSSDRPEGFGGKDLYRVVKLPNGEWSLPLNLGPGVNTPYDEEAPYVHPDGKSLYFSSKGHKTMGGFDIFQAERNEDGRWHNPQNVGYPVNSVFDDIYFVLSGSGKTGYFSSQSEDGLGDQDLYTVTFTDSERDLTILKGRTLDKASGEPIEADITLTNLDSGELEGLYLSNFVNGKVLLVIPPWQQFELLIEAEGYETQIIELTYPGSEGFREITQDFHLVKSGN